MYKELYTEKSTEGERYTQGGVNTEGDSCGRGSLH